MSSNTGFNTSNKVKCFGSSAAICFEETLFPESSPNAGIPTINLEIAPRQGSDVQWNRKLIFQLSDRELPDLVSVFLGYSPGLKIKRPAQGLDVERQQGKILFRGHAGQGKLFLVPVVPGDAFKACCLLLKRLKQQTGFDSEGVIVAALRGAASM
jgi:hypothetical protein